MCVIMQKFVAIGQTADKIWRSSIFQNGCRPPYWVFKSKFWSCAGLRGLKCIYYNDPLKSCWVVGISRFFGRPFIKRFALCYRTVVLSWLSVCNVGVLWPYLAYRYRPRLWPHCVRWGPRKGHSSPPPLFAPCLLWPRSPISATVEILFKMAAVCHLGFVKIGNVFRQ